MIEAKAKPQLYGRDALAQKLAIPLRAADALLAEKKIKSFKIGRRRVVSEEAITQFIKQQEKGA